MSSRIAQGCRVVLSFCLLAMLGGVIHAQELNQTIVNARMRSVTQPEHPLVRLPSDLPTYLTTINFPLLHGAYATWPYAVPISFTNGASLPAGPPDLSMRPVPVVTKAYAAQFDPPAMSAMIDVFCPASADLFFQGMRIPESGTHRRFASPALNPLLAYAYDVKAVWMGIDGQWVTQTQRIVVRSGDRLTMTFPTTSPGVSQPLSPGSPGVLQPLSPGNGATVLPGRELPTGSSLNLRP
jgi:uncharacterized protein (TIGR03000 family)